MQVQMQYLPGLVKSIEKWLSGKSATVLSCSPLYIPNGVTNGCLVITFIMFIVYANDDKVKGEKRKPGRQS